MEAGYDYLHGRLKRRFVNLTGMVLLAAGVLLLASGGAYYVYAANAKSNLDNMVSIGPARTVASITGSRASNVGLFPGKAVAAESWTNLLRHEPFDYRQLELLDGFTTYRGSDSAMAATRLATRIMIPSIGIDSSITELSIVDLGDSRYYESPDNTVGHIPETGRGNAWFFGHTESPISREGSVFFNLQKVPQKLRHGEDVFIITDHGIGQLLYRVTSSRVIHQDDLTLDATPSADINLVSSVPRFVYDHRLVISGDLIGFK